ncbi:MAPEG family protein [Sphingomonas paeninsulae]|uniref:MAPEG family protein n=1 Tax=Sphingomonas paeninsulae TaxID=2319844 RepID=A0A494TLM4_SPHPE|nr:MAPEG family protein [Sphingomonas paeninsulae]AYJ86726.1 MAPEG family protein [Sphingomonas paeninsulae]
MILPVTLTAAGAAALINLWLAIRVGQKRKSEQVSVGDGGKEPLIARMRAQANFIEYTPIVLILFAVIELASGTSLTLWITMAVFLMGRVAHPFGMDGWMPGRMIGTLTTFAIMLGLAIYAIAIPYMAPAHVVPTEMLLQG